MVLYTTNIPSPGFNNDHLTIKITKSTLLTTLSDYFEAKSGIISLY